MESTGSSCLAEWILPSVLIKYVLHGECIIIFTCKNAYHKISYTCTHPDEVAIVTQHAIVILTINDERLDYHPVRYL